MTLDYRYRFLSVSFYKRFRFGFLSISLYKGLRFGFTTVGQCNGLCLRCGRLTCSSGFFHGTPFLHRHSLINLFSRLGHRRSRLRHLLLTFQFRTLRRFLR